MKSFWIRCLMQVSVGMVAILATAYAAMAIEANAESGPMNLEDILCVGNTRTSCEYIEGLLTVSRKEAIDDEKLKESELRLEVSGLFKTVDLSLTKGTERGLAILKIEVEEASGYTINPTFGVTSPTEHPYAFLDVTGANQNLTGHADTLSLRVRTDYGFSKGFYGFDENHAPGNYNNYGRVEYQQPRLFGSGLTLTVGVSALHFKIREYSWEGIFSDEYVETKATSYSLHTNATLSFQVSSYSTLSIGYGRKLLDNLAEENTTVLWAFLNRRTDNYFFRWDRTTEDDPNFPTDGSRFRLGITNFPGVSLGWHRHWSVSEKNVLTFKLGGFASNDGLLEYTDSSLSLRYAHHFVRHASSASVKNGLWYVEPGFFASERANALGIKAGTTFETSFGIVNLYAIATTEKL